MTTSAGRPLRLLDLGLREYAEVWAQQRDLVAARQRDEIPDTLVLVEHPDVITLGRGARRENLRDAARIPVFEVERGGGVTYHGPGQLIGYPILQLDDDERDLHRFLRRLEATLILTLGEFGLQAGRRAGFTGVWLGENKLASIGVAVRRWVTMHGFALNVCTDLARFAAINPCGLDAAVMTSVQAALARPVTVAEVKPPLLGHFAEVFQRRWDGFAGA